MKRILSYFLPKLPVYLVYMLQQVEYEPNKFLGWIVRLPQLNHVMLRQRLVWTKKAKLLVIFLYGFILLYVLACMAAAILKLYSALILLLVLPLVTIALLYLVVLAAWLVLEQPRRNQLIAKSEVLFKNHQGIKIAIAGSYGKTTIKELLLTILSQGKKVAATPGNKNVPISHARWINKLDGDEDVLIIEYGEGAPGDIARFAKTTHPNIGIITGLAPNHLDHYKTEQAVADDLLSLTDYLNQEDIYANTESKDLQTIGKLSEKQFVGYSREGVGDVKISSVELSLGGMEFQANIGNDLEIKCETALIGKHLIGPLALCVNIAHKLGLSQKQIQAGVALTKPYEHRMQPRHVNGAWVIDDTYNGSLEGFRAGLELLKELPAKRKIYVTPGLVDQGEETEKVHFEIGNLIANANPNQAILMKNSMTAFIRKGLDVADYQGEVIVRDDPLDFYTNLHHYVASGDLLMLQNDWTDNYY